MTAPKQDQTRRGQGQRGSAIVTALVLLFAFTAGGVIWLARDVNRSVSNRSAAQSIAFQAARAGAQQVAVGSLREGNERVVLDEVAARSEASRIGGELFGAYDLEGTISTRVDGDIVTVTVTVEDPVGNVTAQGSVQAQTGP